MATRNFNPFRSAIIDKYRDPLFNLYAATIGLFVGLVTVFRAANTGITFDEASTYMRYSQSLSGFLKLETANNHPINSLLIFLSTQITGQAYNEFAIRLPNLLAFAAYLIIAYKISRYLRYPFLTFSLLTLNYFLDEYFGLARGYGLSSTFILIGLYVYIKNRKSGINLVLSLFWLTLASATLYSNLVVVACFVVYAAFIDIGLLKIWDFVKTYGVYLAVIFLAGLYLAYALSLVTAAGNPLFGADNHNFFQAVPYSFAGMFTSNGFLQLVLSWSGLALLIGVLVRSIKRIETIPFTALILSTLLITYLLAVLFQKPLPTGRELLPSYPILALAISESIGLLVELWSAKVPSTLTTVGLGIIILFIMADYINSININYTTDWQDNYQLRNTAYLSAIYHQPLPSPRNPVLQFYVNQIQARYHYKIR